MSIVLKRVSKIFGEFTAVKNIQLEIPTGDFVALLGPSGSGKTTLLRLIAGLEAPNSGNILFNGQDFTGKSVKERQVGFVFQHYALFKHMTIFENIAFGLKVRPRKLRPSKAEIKAKIEELLQLVQLEGLGERYPSQLSGGQRQRVALARALAVEPEVLLLDEPFGALDAKVRQELRIWLRELHQKLNITTVFVTHDQEEAMEMADTVVVMNNGRIEQTGSPENVYENPVNPFVYSFLGRVNEFRGNTLGGYTTYVPEKNISDKTVGYIRPHEIGLSSTFVDNSYPAEVSHVNKVGAAVRIELRRLDTDDLFEAELSTEKYGEIGPLKRGDQLYAEFQNLVIFMENNITGLEFEHFKPNLLLRPEESRS
jgi:sulfate/thiosulfate transport system ATP-binding protein